MATAKKKAPVKKATNRRTAAKSAPAAKRVVRRSRKPVAVAAPEYLTSAQAQEQNDPLSQDTLTDANQPGPADGQTQQDPLVSADVLDLRGINVTGRFLMVLGLERKGYIFDRYSNEDATDVFYQYLGAAVQGLRLQHRNKLIAPVVEMDALPAELSISAPMVSSVHALLDFTDPAPAAPAEIRLGGTLYKKNSD